MYTAFLTIHSYLRWVVFALVIVVLMRAIGGVRARRGWEGTDETAGRWCIISLDVQALFGIVIYVFLSPFTSVAFADLAATMRDPALRLIMVEHPVGMLVAIVLAHVGRARSRKAGDPARRHRAAALFYGVALLVMLLTTPWPFMAGGRAFFRGL
jgi:hypothetical protein